MDSIGNSLKHEAKATQSAGVGQAHHLTVEREFWQMRVELLRPKPEEGDGPYQEYFQCEVLFDRPALAISMDSAILDLPLSGSSRELAQMHDKTVAGYLEKIGRQDIVGRARIVMVDNLSSGRVSKELVAEK